MAKQIYEVIEEKKITTIRFGSDVEHLWDLRQKFFAFGLLKTEEGKLLDKLISGLNKVKIKNEEQ